MMGGLIWVKIQNMNASEIFGDQQIPMCFQDDEWGKKKRAKKEDKIELSCVAAFPKTQNKTQNEHLWSLNFSEQL